MLGILKVKMSLEYPTFKTAFESGLGMGATKQVALAPAEVRLSSCMEPWLLGIAEQ